MNRRPPKSPLFPSPPPSRPRPARPAPRPVARAAASRGAPPPRTTPSGIPVKPVYTAADLPPDLERRTPRSEEHTSELQSQSNLVCRLLLEKKKKNKYHTLVS